MCKPKNLIILTLALVKGCKTRWRIIKDYYKRIKKKKQILSTGKSKYYVDTLGFFK